jgi:hypothetical protein
VVRSRGRELLNQVSAVCVPETRDEVIVDHFPRYDIEDAGNQGNGEAGSKGFQEGNLAIADVVAVGSVPKNTIRNESTMDVFPMTAPRSKPILSPNVTSAIIVSEEIAPEISPKVTTIYPEWQRSPRSVRRRFRSNVRLPGTDTRST